MSDRLFFLPLNISSCSLYFLNLIWRRVVFSWFKKHLIGTRDCLPPCIVSLHLSHENKTAWCTNHQHNIYSVWVFSATVKWWFAQHTRPLISQLWANISMVWWKCTWLIQVEASSVVNFGYHKHTTTDSCDNTLPCGTALIQEFCNLLLLGVWWAKCKRKRMCYFDWRTCSFNSVANSSICVLNTRFEHWICSSGLTDEHTHSILSVQYR